MEGVASFAASEADKKRFVVGTRVEAWYWGTWYKATVTGVPDEGCYWTVQCDSDPAGTSTKTHRLRAIEAAQRTSSNGFRDFRSILAEL